MTHKHTSGKLEKRKPQKIGNSSNNDRAGARKCRKNHRTIPVPDSLSL